MITSSEINRGVPIDEDSAIHVLETLAARHHVVPLTKITLGSPSAVSQLTARLVHGPSSSHPWLPVGTLGPLLIMGHYNPAATDLLGVPDPFCVRAVITMCAYEKRHYNFFAQWSRRERQLHKQRSSQISPLTESPLSRPSTMLEALDWFTRNYPLKDEERLAFLDKRQSLSECEAWRQNRMLDGLSPQLGVALETLRTGELAFSPDCAPRLPTNDPGLLSILERHRAYPLLDSPRIRYWLCGAEVDLDALERDWRHGSTAKKKVLRVLANENAILSRLRQETLR